MRSQVRHDLETLALLPTWECDVACHHCVFSSSPKKKGRLSIAIASRAIEEIARVTTAKRVTVSGGEAFLDFDYLLAVAETAQREKLSFRVVTNGSFAETQETAREKLVQLKDIGIESLALSWDQYHEQFIDADRVRNTIRACRDAGISVRLTAVVSRRSRLDAALGMLGDEGFELPVTQVKCLPVGRAEKKVRREDLLAPSKADIGRSCRNDFDTLSLTPSGDVFPCCTVGGFTDGIKLGRFPDETMGTLLARRDTELKWIALASQGPHYFLSRMKPQQREELGLGGDPVHDCVTCYRLFRTADGVRAVNEVIAELETQARGIWRRAQDVGEQENTRHERCAVSPE